MYDIHQDQRGYVWLATARGISRFDGRNFKNFGVAEGLPSDNVFELVSTSDGKIWCNVEGNQLVYLENGRFHKPSWGDTLKRFPSLRIGKLTVEDNKLVVGLQSFAYDPNYLFLKEQEDGQISLVKESISQEKNAFIFQGENFGLKRNYASDQLTIRASDKRYETQLSNAQIGVFVGMKTEAELLFAENARVVLIKEGKIEEFNIGSNFSSGFFKESDDEFWIGTHLKGIVRFNSNGIIGNSFLKGESVSDIVKDKQGAYWVSTLSSGVFYIANKSLFRAKSRTKDHHWIDGGYYKGKFILRNAEHEFFELVLDENESLNRVAQASKIFSSHFGEQQISLSALDFESSFNSIPISTHRPKPAVFHSKNRDVHGFYTGGWATYAEKDTVVFRGKEFGILRKVGQFKEQLFLGTDQGLFIQNGKNCFKSSDSLLSEYRISSMSFSKDY